MRCQWQAFLNILPPSLRQMVDNRGREDLQELRLRLGAAPELVTGTGSVWLPTVVTKEHLSFCINTTCKYSPWSVFSASQGYLTAPGGHRMGICGDAVYSGEKLNGIREPTSLCIRVARDFPGIAERIGIRGSLLILGKPGSGKTTLLRDMIRQRSDKGNAAVSVVDERGEIFPYCNGQPCFPTGKRTDVLTGCRKPQGVLQVLRTMGPGAIAVDEITEEADCSALLQAGWCGVDILATAHAGSVNDLLTRPVYRSLVDSKLFDRVIVLQADKSWTEERLRL